MILALLCIVLLKKCTSAPNGAINLEEVITIEEPHDTIRSFPLLDNRGVLHKYRDDFDKLIFPKDNRKLTQYCGKHFQWESIKARWKKNNIGEWGWSYMVSRSKKQ
jgi:hypothetical protein